MGALDTEDLGARVGVGVEVDRPTGPWRAAQARMSGSAIPWSPPRTIGIAPGVVDLSHRALDRLVAADRVGGKDGRVAVVEDPQDVEAVDLRLQMRPGWAAGGADRTRAETRARPVGNEVVGREPRRSPRRRP